MKKLSLLLSLLFLFLISCNQNSDQEIQPAQVDVVAKNAVPNSLANARPMPPTMYQVITSAGQYLSPYGGGITFGTSFIRNITVDPSGNTDGEPSGGFTFVNPQVGSVVAYTIDNNYFGILVPGGSTVNPDQGEAEAWLEEYIDGVIAGGGRMASGARTQNVPGGGGETPPNGMILISGQVVRDHNSPTNAAVTSVDYVYSPGNPPSDNGGSIGQCTVALCGMRKSNKDFRFYVTLTETSGTICKVTAANLGTTYTVSSYSLSYTSNFSTATVVGSVVIGGVTYTFNDTMNVYQI